MSDEPTPSDLERQLRQHIDSLRSAGIEWVPTTPQSSSPPGATRPLTLVSDASVQVSLFASTPQTEVVSADQESRLQQLQALRAQVAACTRCPQLASTRTQTVFGVGPLDPEICFVGEAPGAEEDRKGEPFVGPAGQLLDRIIAACGMRREEVYICNILRCRPPGNRQPQVDEAEHCKEWLEKTIALVRPRWICALGGTAVTHLLGITQGITRLRGRIFEYRGIPVLCTFHPSYLLRSPEKKRDVWEDMKLLLGKLGRPIPGKPA
ncbi:MAG: uracil-DNA glycosylase [Gemmataceae bacterium]